MFESFRAGFQRELDAIREAGTYKDERVISSPQSAAIQVPQGEVINFCANNYLGLADNPEIIARAKRALDERGFGMASVRFICGTQDLHKELENVIRKEEIPRPYREYIKQYFLSIGLGKEMGENGDAQ